MGLQQDLSHVRCRSGFSGSIREENRPPQKPVRCEALACGQGKRGGGAEASATRPAPQRRGVITVGNGKPDPMVKSDTPTATSWAMAMRGNRRKDAM